jgi:hypothetical protein
MKVLLLNPRSEKFFPVPAKPYGDQKRHPYFRWLACNGFA